MSTSDVPADELVVRPALPGDVDAAVPLMYSSGPSAFEFVFGHASRGAAPDFLRRAFVDGAGEFGYRCHVVGLLGGRVVAVGAGYSGRAAGAFLVAALRQIAAHYGLAAGNVIARGLRTEQVIRPAPRNAYYIAHLGTDPALRSRGIGERLTRHLIERGAQEGYARAALDVSVENPRAQELYERLGFEVAWEMRSTLQNRYGAVASHRRMERAYGADVAILPRAEIPGRRDTHAGVGTPVSAGSRTRA